MLLNVLLKEIKATLASAKIDEAEVIGRALVCDVLRCTTTDLIMWANRHLEASQEEAIRSAVGRVIAGLPLQYATGVAYFDGEYFNVDNRVLIPRPETSELVHWVCQEISCKESTPSVLDVGTGSGCIALSVKRRCPNANVSALDVSDGALEVASANAKALDLHVDLVQMDILQSCPTACYDVVVSNPPYVMERERSSMEKNVLDHEPALALFVPDDDPLVFYRTIARHCMRGLLANDGSLFFEINEALGDEMAQMLQAEGFGSVELRKDYCGKDRMIKARKA